MRVLARFLFLNAQKNNQKTKKTAKNNQKQLRLTVSKQEQLKEIKSK